MCRTVYRQQSSVKQITFVNYMHTHKTTRLHVEHGDMLASNQALHSCNSCMLAKKGENLVHMCAEFG